VDPVTDLSSGTALYFISNNATTDLPHDGTTPDVVIAEFSGNTTATISESDHAADIIASLAPPAAPQSGTAAYTIDTDDDRIDIGVWSGGAIWTAFDELCAEGSVNVACIRYVEIDTASMTVTQDINFGIPGAYVYYPSLGVDPAGDFLSTFTTSSTTTDPTVMAVGMPAGQSSLSNPVTVVAGSGPYDDSDATDGVCSVSNDPVTHTTACRYGDYAGGAMDPLHPDDLWFANEVQLSTTATDWGTEIGRLTYGAPTISGFTPSAGPTTGGVTVTVSGSDFAAGATFSFGGAATTISGLTPDSFTFVPPGSSGSPHATGSVSGAVTDSRGTSNSVSYTYLPPSRYEPMTPYRICDTRSAASLGYTDQCNASGPAPLGQGGVMTVQVEGYAPPGYGGPTVPGTATAVVLNVTAVTPTVGTYLSVYPDGTAVPNASSLNTNAGQTIANLVTIPMETDGSVDVYNSLGVVDVVVDVQGYYAAASGGSSGLYHPLSPPVRICDSRAGQGTACNDGVSDDPLGLTNVRQVTVWGGTGGIPTNGTAEAAVLNLTGVSGTAGTYLTVYPTDAAHTCSAPPGTSSLNLSAQTNQANRVVVPVDATNGAVCVYNSLGSINFILDVNGWYGNGTDTGGAAFYPISPTRICDTRSGSSTECAGQTLGQGGIDLVAVEGSGPLPSSGIVGLVANVTAVSGTAGTFVTVWPAGTTRTTSDINANAGVNIANLDVVAIPGDGDVDVYNSLGTINVVIDALGWFA
jgi:hypothetical protein